MMAVGLLVMVLLLALVVAGIAWLVRIPTRWQPGRQTAAVDRLEWRYAGGELDRDEYLLRREDLVGR